MPAIGNMGEHELIERLTGRLGGHPDLSVGPGDDCAVARLPGSELDQVFTTDPVIEGVHFLSAEDPARVGRKAAGRILSDIAAMGATPQWILVNVVAAPEQNAERLERIYAGMVKRGAQFGATIIGGDVTRGSGLELHLFGTGVLPSGSALLRSGAKPGDALFVTGPLGCSIEGNHLDFIPRVEEGRFLRESGAVTAMMDLSDGLATDLRHLLKQSGAGAELLETAVPRNGSLEQALYDGEDYELLFTVEACLAAQLMQNYQERFGQELFRVGTVTDQPGDLMLRQGDGRLELLDRKGFEHFSDSGG